MQKISIRQKITLITFGLFLSAVLLEIGLREFKEASGEVGKKNEKINSEDDEWAYINLGNHYNLQGLFIKAEVMFKKALEINPRNSNAYQGLGDIYRMVGRHNESEQMLKKAKEINQENK